MWFLFFFLVRYLVCDSLAPVPEFRRIVVFTTYRPHSLKEKKTNLWIAMTSTFRKTWYSKLNLKYKEYIPWNKRLLFMKSLKKKEKNTCENLQRLQKRMQNRLTSNIRIIGDRYIHSIVRCISANDMHPIAIERTWDRRRALHTAVTVNDSECTHEHLTDQNGVLILRIPKLNCSLLIIWETPLWLLSAWLIESHSLRFLGLKFSADMKSKVYTESIAVKKVGSPRARQFSLQNLSYIIYKSTIVHV